MKANDALVAVLRELEHREVPYMVTGSYATEALAEARRSAEG